MTSGQPSPRVRAGAAVALVVLTAAAAVGIGRLRFNDSYHDLFRSSDPAYAAMEQTAAQFGADDQLLVILLEGDDVLRTDVVAAERQLRLTLLLDVDGIASVYSALDAQARDPQTLVLRPVIPDPDVPTPGPAPDPRAALKHPLVSGTWLARDGRAALMAVRLRDDLQHTADIAPVLEQVRLRARAAMAPLGVRSRVTGLPALRVEIVRGVQRDQLRFNLIGIAAALGVSFLLFRRIGPMLIAAAGPLCGVAWALGLLGLSGEPINALNNVVPQLMLVIGFTDSLHYVFDIGRSRAAGLSPLASAWAALRHLAPACALTTGTTVLGFLPLVLSDAEVLHRFGLACMAGSVLSFLAVGLVVPFLASTRLGASLIARDEHRGTSWPERMAALSLRRPRIIAGIGLVLFTYLAVAATRLQPDYKYSEGLTSSTEETSTIASIDHIFGGSWPVYAVVEWPAPMSLESAPVLAALREVESTMARVPSLTPPVSVLGFLRAVSPSGATMEADGVPFLFAVPPEVRSQWLREDLRLARVTAYSPDAGAATLTPVFDQLAASLREVETRHPGFHVRLTGLAVASATSSLNMISQLGQSLAATAAGIFLLIGIGTKSWRLGLISILPNVFPLAGAAAALYWFGFPLQYVSAAAFAICLGLTTDDSIHFLSAVRRELKNGADPEAATRAALRSVGSVMVTTALVLAAGFATVLASSLPTVRVFGGLSCAILIFSIVGDVVLLPSLLVLFLRRSRR